MKTDAEIKTEINRLSNKIKNEKAFLRNCEEITMMEEDLAEEEIYLMAKNIKILEWVLN
ncbi:MAG: hypothetical protein ACJAVA_000280 [Flavobacteriaceae bacterium]|jgi:hypothetical protein